MTQLLTTGQIGRLLNVDRTTVYRMAESGRIPAVRVGKQWRFPQSEIDRWMQAQRSDVSPAGAVRSPANTTAAALLPIVCMQGVQDLVAELLGAAVIVVDLQGRTLTRPSNLNALHGEILRRSQGRVDCLPGWLAFGDATADAFAVGPLGMRWTRGFLRLDEDIVGVVLVGGVLLGSTTIDEEQLEAAAVRIGAPLEMLRTLAGHVPHCDDVAGERIVRHAQRLADVFGEMAQERRAFCGKLQAIAAMTIL
jgi:excisionase family DNA binding protein